MLSANARCSILTGTRELLSKKETPHRLNSEGAALAKPSLRTLILLCQALRLSVVVFEGFL